MKWNIPPERFKHVSDSDLKFQMNLEARIIALKDELADLARKDPKITIEKAIPKIRIKYDDQEQLSLLDAAIDKLKLYNIKEYTVRRYLPVQYLPKNKPRFYLPDDL